MHPQPTNVGKMAKMSQKEFILNQLSTGVFLNGFEFKNLF